MWTASSRSRDETCTAPEPAITTNRASASEPPGRHQRDHAPATDDRMQCRAAAHCQPGRRRPAATQLTESAEHARPGEHLGLAAADHPLAGHRGAPQCQCEDCGRREPAGTRGHDWPDGMPKADGQREPAREPPDPRRLVERHRRGERSEDAIEDAMGIGRLEKEVARGPRRIHGMPRLREVDRLVEIGHGPGTGGCEGRHDHCDLDAPPRDRYRPA